MSGVNGLPIGQARELDALGYVPWWRARTLCAYWGQFTYTDSIYFCQTYDAYKKFENRCIPE